MQLTNRSEKGRKRLLPPIFLVCAFWCMEAMPLQTAAQDVEGDGLTAQYFGAYNTFTGTPTFTRIDPQVNFNWLLESPDASLPVDEFSIKWSGMVKAPKTEVYTFTARSDDGVKLVVNGITLIEKLVDQQESRWSGSISLQAGKKYVIELYYIERRSIALCELYWSSPTIRLQIVPTSQLYHEIDINNGGNPTGLEIRDLSSSFAVYPIPASADLHIQSANGAIHASEIKIYNMLGKDLTSTGNLRSENEMVLDISTLEAGSYIVEVGNQRKVFYKK